MSRLGQIRPWAAFLRGPIVRDAHGLMDLMDLTPYQAKYFAYELTKRCPTDSMEKLAGWIEDPKVGLGLEIKEFDRQI